jgi:hypothetical protein
MTITETTHRDLPLDSKREQRVNLEPQPGLRWLVCKNQVKGVGRGVTVVVFVHGQKVLKFDIFDQHAAHYHILTGNPTHSSGQLALQEASLDALTRRLLFDLQHNLRGYLRLNCLDEVRTFALDSGRVTAALGDLEAAIKARGSF